jgi:hypothetical protein
VNANEKNVYENIAKAAFLTNAADRIQVGQTPTFLEEPIQVADFATAVVAATGASIAELGEERGLPAQKISVDRRHATLTTNNAGFHYLNGVWLLATRRRDRRRPWCRRAEKRKRRASDSVRTVSSSTVASEAS